MWYVYILRCGDGSLYTGITPDVQARLAQHRQGKGAKYTRGRGPLTLVYSELCGNRAAASRRELEVKSMTRAEKQQLVESGRPHTTSLLIHPEELTKKWIDRMISLGVNTLALHPRGGKNAHESLEEMLQQLQQPQTKELLDYAAASGLTIEYEFHSAAWLLPRHLFESQPTLFRMDENGERTADRNFCPSNPTARRKVLAASRQLAGRLYRTTDHYYFWLDDGRRLACQCPDCAKLSASDQQLLMMNKIIRTLRKQDPNAKLAYLAYYACMEVPKTVKPEKGIFLEYAPIDRDFTRSVRETTDEAHLKALLDYFGRKDSKVLEYWFDNSLFSGQKKPEKKFVPNNRLIREDIDYYRSLGFETISSFACFLGPDYEALHGEPDLSAFQAE